MSEQQGNGDPVNPGRMWIGFGLLAASVVIVVLGYADEEAAETIGAGFAPIVFGLLIAAVIRMIWARGRPTKAFELSGFILCAGIVAVIFGAVGVAGKSEDDQTAQDTRDTLEQLDLQEY